MAIDYKKILKGIVLKNPTDQTKQLQVEVSNSATTATKTTVEAAQTANRTVTLPDATTVLVGTDATQTLTNKTINADNNTITNIDNNEIKANAAIDATKIADGSISNTEFQYLDGLNANIQDQIDDANTDLIAHILDTTDAHDASAISNIPSGNLTATDLQSAVNELQTDIDTRATSAILTAHTGASSGVHGVSGAVVGTTDTQTLTNKTIVVASNTITTAASGNLIATELNTALSELQSDIDTRALNADLNVHMADTTTHGTTGDIVGTSDAQVLTNKDIDGGTAANTRRITLPKDTLTNLQGLTRKEGTLVYATDTDKPYYDDGTNLKVIGSGSGGDINLITDGDAEAANIFVAYADAAASRPVDGTGGSPTVTATISSSSPLAGSNSFVLTKDAANRQGQGIAATTITVDPAYRAKVMQIEFDYIVGSGTFVAGTSTTDSDVIVYIYDVTNSTLIEPSSIKLLSNSSTTSDKFIANFQTSMTGTSYRLILHCATTSASAYTLKIDNVKIKPCDYVYGTPITDWASYTPTGTWSTNTTWTGLWRRVGQDMEVRFQASLSGAPSGNFTANIPAGYTIDTTKLLSTSTQEEIGFGRINDSGSAVYHFSLRYNSTVSIIGINLGVSGTYLNEPSVVDTTTPITFGAGDFVNGFFKVPIVGWSSSVQMSDSYDGRLIASRYTSASSSCANGTRAQYNTVDYDKTGSVITGASWVFTAPSYGIYRINQMFNTTAAANTVGQFIGYILYKNGSSTSKYVTLHYVNTTSSVSYSAKGYLDVELNAGETIDLRSSENLTNDPSLDGSAGLNYIEISKLQSPQTISATERISASYSASGAISWTATGGGNFDTKLEDTHNAVTTGANAWKFTAPYTGKYSLSVTVTTSSSTAAFAVYKNGTLYKYLFRVKNVSGDIDSGTVDVPMNAGDYIDVRLDSSTLTGDSSPNANNVYIKLIK